MLQAFKNSPAFVNAPQKNYRWLTILLYIFYAALVFYSRHNGFFWDNILQASRAGQWFYSTNFSHFFYPPIIDAGYSPLFGLMVAFSWKIFGYNLVVSHLLVLPFAIGIVHQVLSLSRKLLPASFAVPAAALALADPTLLAQITQVSPDVLLLFFYVFSLNQLLQNRRFLVAVALVFLGLLSLRGTLAVAAFFFSDVFLLLLSREKFQRKKIYILALTYAPAVLLVTGWLYLHYLHTGWAAYNPDPAWSWSEGRQILPLAGMFRNVVIIGWRILDFGRLAIWLMLAFVGFYFYKKRLAFSAATVKLLAFTFIPLLLFSLISLPYSNPIGHRYFLIVYVFSGLLVCNLLAYLSDLRWRWLLYGFMLLSLLTGHFWIYPDTVAKGWDATLAHLPYFSLKQEAISYLDEKNISLKNVGSAFPNTAPLSVTDLKPDNRSFKAKDLQTDTYILYSNIFNDFSDAELTVLKTRWQPVKHWQKGQVKIILYQRPGKNN